MSKDNAQPIGGYFELERPSVKSSLYPQALHFQSARAAFLAILRMGKPNRVWMPKYICNSMLAPLEAEEIEIAFYALNKRLEIADDIKIKPLDWLLYVNYYGICDNQETEILDKYNPQQVIFDHSQAFYSPPRDCLATIYSPRKFFGIPDGGLLVTQLQVQLPEQEDQDSERRMMYLIKRLGGTPESGYEAYKLAEASLELTEPKRMSTLTKRLLVAVDFDEVRLRRNNNFMTLHKFLDSVNSLEVILDEVESPLCYPFVTRDKSLRKRLINNRIFVPTYWEEAINRVDDKFSEIMVHNCLPLPIDQRYCQLDMERIASVIQNSQ